MFRLELRIIGSCKRQPMKSYANKREKTNNKSISISMGRTFDVAYVESNKSFKLNLTTISCLKGTFVPTHDGMNVPLTKNSCKRFLYCGSLGRCFFTRFSLNKDNLIHVSPQHNSNFHPHIRPLPFTQYVGFSWAHILSFFIIFRFLFRNPHEYLCKHKKNIQWVEVKTTIERK